jgi:hypothetical protein
MAEEKDNDDVFTNDHKLTFAGIPLRAQVLNIGTQELHNDVDRRQPINDSFNIRLTDRYGSTIFVTAEERAEIDLANTLGDDYSKKTWLYGHYLKTAPDADFTKYGMSEVLTYTLSDASTTIYPRHMPLGAYSIRDPTYGYISFEELQRIRQVDNATRQQDNTSLHTSTGGGGSLSMSALGGSQTSSVLNNVVIHATAGHQLVQLQTINSTEFERLRSFYDGIQPGTTKPSLVTTLGRVRTDIETIFQMADTTQVPELLAQTPNYKGHRWLDWTFDQLYPILKKCLNLMTTATDVNSIKTALDKKVLRSTTESWSQPMTFVHYKGEAYGVLKDNSVMNRETDEMNSMLTV